MLVEDGVAPHCRFVARERHEASAPPISATGSERLSASRNAADCAGPNLPDARRENGCWFPCGRRRRCGHAHCREQIIGGVGSTGGGGEQTRRRGESRL